MRKIWTDTSKNNPPNTKLPKINKNIFTWEHLYECLEQHLLMITKLEMTSYSSTRKMINLGIYSGILLSNARCYCFTKHIVHLSCILPSQSSQIQKLMYCMISLIRLVENIKLQRWNISQYLLERGVGQRGVGQRDNLNISG